MSRIKATKVIFDRGLTATVDCTAEVKEQIAALQARVRELETVILAVYMQHHISEMPDVRQAVSSAWREGKRIHAALLPEESEK